MKTEEIKTFFKKYVPDIDGPILNYFISILSGDPFESAEDLYESIGQILYSYMNDLLTQRPEASQEDVMEICKTLYTRLCETVQNDKDDEQFKLRAPVHMGSMNGGDDDSWKSIWAVSNAVESKVDQRKLQKAEEKLRQKAERRDGSSLPPESTLPRGFMTATASQAISKKNTKDNQSGQNKTKDIKIENFDISFGSHVLLQGATLSMGYGIRYGLCGRNGIGKSTLLQMISNGSLVIPGHLSILHVEQEVIGDDTTALESVLECDVVRNKLLTEEKELIKLANPTTEEAERLQQVYVELATIEADKAPARASIILCGLGFTAEMQARATKTFSGGWRMRIALARALFSKPDLLLLDEPTNMLDMKAIMWLTDYLVRFWTSTLLTVSHDKKFLSDVPNSILHFHNKKIESYKGNYTAFVNAMTEKLKNQQREYEAQQQYKKASMEFIDRFRFNAKRASLVQSRIKQLEKLKEVEPVEAEQGVVLKFPEPELLAPPIIQMDEVTFGYTKDKILLRNVNLNANMQSRIVIVGDNGSGKTTLLKLLIGDLEPVSGVRHCHRNLAVGYFTQHHVDQLTMNVTPIQFMASRDPGKNEEHYRRYLGRFGVTGDLSLQPLGTLSGGQKSRVAFAAMTLTNPHMLILDEPTNHLDVETVDALADSIKEYKGGVILVTHDQYLIENVCEELWYCGSGSVTCLKGGFPEYKKLVESEIKDLFTD